MKSGIVKRLVVVHAYKANVSLEDAVWRAPEEIARARDLRLGQLFGTINTERTAGSLSSMLRLFVLTRNEAMRHQVEREAASVQPVAVP